MSTHSLGLRTISIPGMPDPVEVSVAFDDAAKKITISADGLGSLDLPCAFEAPHACADLAAAIDADPAAVSFEHYGHDQLDQMNFKMKVGQELYAWCSPPLQLTGGNKHRMIIGSQSIVIGQDEVGVATIDVAAL